MKMFCHSFLLFCAIFLLPSCNSKNSQEAPNSETVEDLSGPPLIVIEDAEAVKSPDKKGDIVMPITAGQTARLLELRQSKDGNAEEDFDCFQKTFARVQLENGASAWVHGKFIAELNQASDLIENIDGKKLSIGGVEYHLTLAQNYSIGTAYEGEIIGCEEFYPMVFYQNNYENMQMAELVDSPHSEFPYCNLVSNEGVGEKISAVEQQEDKVVFKIACLFQEGTGSYDLEISRRGDKLVGQVKNFERVWQ